MKIVLCLFLFLSTNAFASGKRVDVYDKAQTYREVKSGDSLSEICRELQPAGKQKACQQEILEKNPAAFINQDPNRLLAGKRLWLPGSYRPVSKLDHSKYTVKTFSWGSIKTPK